MARTTKPGIDYFSHDVHMMSDIKIKLLKAKHGLIAYAIFLRLLEDIYADKGYYLEINDNYDILFIDDNNLDLNVYNEILNDCIKNNLFDKKMYEKYKILTSVRIQSNYCEAIGRRMNVFFIKEYLLTDVNLLINTKKVNVYINLLNVYNETLNVDIGTQSKGEENKGEENTNTDDNDYEIFFNECWKLYPNKKGKSTIKDTTKKRVYKLGEEFIRAINRYSKEVQGKEKQFMKHGSTFWNSGYEDYLDDNYEEETNNEFEVGDF